MIVLFCDNLTRIRNGLLRKKIEIQLKFNKSTVNLLHLLWRTKLIDGWNLKGREIIVKPSFCKNKIPIIKEIKAISKPSFKRHITLKKLSEMSFKEGFFVLSTDKGILTSFECLKRNVGGVLLCYFGFRWNVIN